MKTEIAIPTLSPLEILLHTITTTMVKFPYGICQKAVAKRHQAVCCDLCDKWIHIACNNLNKKHTKIFSPQKSAGSACLA